MTSSNSLALVVVEQGAGGDEDARPLLEGALHLGKEVVVETRQGLPAPHRTLVLLREASREVDERLNWQLQTTCKMPSDLIIVTPTPPLRWP